jgi:triacylglycerol lipase
MTAMKLRLSVALAFLFACGVEATGSSVPGAADDTTPPHPAEAPAPPPSPAGVTPALGAPYPIVLMHGMGGFGKLDLGPVDVTYFKGVVEDLSKSGEAVYVTLAPPFETSEVRAEAVAKQIDEILKRTGKAKVNLVGHSQGGLDARVLASPNGLAYGDRIASVTTIATPHRGSRVADAVLGMIAGLSPGVVDQITSDLLALVEKTVYELQTDPKLRAQLLLLSEANMNGVFNAKYVNDPNVLYMSYAGRSNLRTGVLSCNDGVYPNDPTDLDAPQLSLAATALFLEQGQLKVNDGLVTVESAKWGVFQQCVPADHLKEVGQFGPAAATFDHLALFRQIVAHVRKAGL